MYILPLSLLTPPALITLVAWFPLLHLKSDGNTGSVPAGLSSAYRVETCLLTSIFNENRLELKQFTAVALLNNIYREPVQLNAASGSDDSTHNSNQSTSVELSSGPHRKSISSVSSLGAGDEILELGQPAVIASIRYYFFEKENP